MKLVKLLISLLTCSIPLVSLSLIQSNPITTIQRSSNEIINGEEVLDKEKTTFNFTKGMKWENKEFLDEIDFVGYSMITYNAFDNIPVSLAHITLPEYISLISPKDYGIAWINVWDIRVNKNNRELKVISNLLCIQESFGNNQIRLTALTIANRLTDNPLYIAYQLSNAYADCIVIARDFYNPFVFSKIQTIKIDFGSATKSIIFSSNCFMSCNVLYTTVQVASKSISIHPGAFANSNVKIFRIKDISNKNDDVWVKNNVIHGGAFTESDIKLFSIESQDTDDNENNSSFVIRWSAFFRTGLTDFIANIPNSSLELFGYLMECNQFSFLSINTYKVTIGSTFSFGIYDKIIACILTKKLRILNYDIRPFNGQINELWVNLFVYEFKPHKYKYLLFRDVIANEFHLTTNLKSDFIKASGLSEAQQNNVRYLLTAYEIINRS